MMRSTVFTILVAAMAVTASGGDSTTVELRYRSYRNWSIELPAEQWFAIKDGIKLQRAGGMKFPVQFVGNNVRFDTDGDGNLDRTIKPLVDAKTDVSTTRVVLSWSTADGEKNRYAVRLRDDMEGWEWAPGGAMVGTIESEAGPVPVRIIDQDGNGRFNDIGTDAMIVGASDHATFLSKTIVVAGRLRRLDVNADGSQISIADYEGPTATIDMTTSFASKAVLLSTILLSEDRQQSFDVGSVDGPVEIPAGTYTVVRGRLGLANHRVDISAGKMKPLSLDVGESREFDWGGPAKTEFRFARSGDKVQFSPQAIWYYGEAGEEYSRWLPVGKSPEFKVIDAESGVVLKVAILPGSC